MFTCLSVDPSERNEETKGILGPAIESRGNCS